MVYLHYLESVNNVVVIIKQFWVVTFIDTKNGLIIKNWFMLSVRISSYGCTREVWRARKKRKSCSRR